MPAIEIRLLGPFEVLRDGRAVTVPGYRLRVLLAVLAMAADRPVPIETIGAAVWGPKPPANLQASVYTYIARLRQMFGDRAISTGGGRYRLAIEPDAVDALRFLRLAAEGAVSALGLWRGQPFAGLRSDWLDDTYGTALTKRYLDLLERRIDQDLANGKAAELVAELSALVDQHPLSESLWARLLTALDRAGRPAEALERYETLRRRLATELAIDPGPELRQIHARLLATDAATGRPFEVPRQLPSDVARFTGRAQSLAQLDRSSSIAVVHGTAGVGKTALAVHWAHHDRFPDGQIFVNLRGFGPGPPVEPSAALDSLLRYLGVPGEQIPSGQDARSAMLRGLLAGRRLLMVLDNARDSGQVRPLLPDPPSQVVVTSRNRLPDLAADDIPLDQLTPDESVALLSAALSRQTAMLAELAELCGHLPLALVVAAEHASRYPDADLAELIGELRQTRLDALHVDDPATSPRAVLSWSYQALEPPAARCFRLLSLHPGPDFGARSVAALIGTPTSRVIELLDRLANGHLVRQTGPNRYEMHDLLRLFAGELCRPQERDQALTRVYDWYLHSAANARKATGVTHRRTTLDEPPASIEAASFDTELEALDWFDRERNALVALVVDAAARGRHRVAYQTTEMMNGYLLSRYRLSEALALQRLARACAEEAGDIRAVAASDNQIGGNYLRLGNHQGAIAHLERAVELFREAGDQLGESTALTNLGTTLRMAGSLSAAAARLKEAVDLARRLGNRAAEADYLNNLAMGYVVLGRYEDAAGACRQAIEIHQATGNQAEPYSLDTLGQALAGLGRHQEAVDQFERALNVYRGTGDPWNECLVLAHLGASQRALGRTSDARANCLKALTRYDELNLTDTTDLRRADLVALLAKAD